MLASCTDRRAIIIEDSFSILFDVIIWRGSVLERAIDTFRFTRLLLKWQLRYDLMHWPILSIVMIISKASNPSGLCCALQTIHNG